MGRGSWLSLIAVGAVLTGVSATGVIAPASDVARTGTEEKDHVQTGPFERAIDLRLAYIGSDGACSAPWVDDFTDPLFSLESQGRDFQPASRSLCIRNMGAEDTSVRLRVADLVGADLTCEADEGAACGGDGELAVQMKVLTVPGQPWCGNFAPVSGDEGSLADHRIVSTESAAAVWEMSPLAAGTACSMQIHIAAVDPSGKLPYEAQTDRLEWRFRFTSF